MENFYQKSENKCNQEFEYFNTKTKLFNNIQRQTLLSKHDYQATTNNVLQQPVNIELKHRNNDVNTYPTVFIEENKYKHLMETFRTTGNIPIYINFFNNKENVVMWNLLDIQMPELKENVRIFDYGKRIFKYENRFLLKPEDGIYYKYNQFKEVYEIQ